MTTLSRLLPVLAALVLTGTAAAMAAPPAKDALKPAVEIAASQATLASERQPAYIVDVQGNRVRLVGPRFYTNPARALDFPGRDELRYDEADR